MNEKNKYSKKSMLFIFLCGIKVDIRCPIKPQSGIEK
jgi:hypothetical protein